MPKVELDLNLIVVNRWGKGFEFWWFRSSQHMNFIDGRGHELFRIMWTLCRLMLSATVSFSQRRCERTSRLVFEIGHAVEGDGDEIECGSTATCAPLALLQ